MDNYLLIPCLDHDNTRRVEFESKATVVVEDRNPRESQQPRETQQPKIPQPNIETVVAQEKEAQVSWLPKEESNKSEEVGEVAEGEDDGENEEL